MIARFDPDGLGWIVVSLVRLLVSLFRVGATAVGTIVMAVVLCGLVYAAVVAIRRYLTEEHAKQDYAHAKRDMPSSPASSKET